MSFFVLFLGLEDAILFYFQRRLIELSTMGKYVFELMISVNSNHFDN